MPAPEHSEPAVRDPKKLRRTAFVLVGVMVVGGWLVMMAYNRYIAERVADDRPAIIHRIEPWSSLRVVRQDGGIADLVDLRDKVVAVHVVHLGQPEDSARSLAVMKRMAQHFAGDDDFRVVTLVLDAGPADGLVRKLHQAAAGMGATLPQWWVAANEGETLSTFVRKELKPSTPPRVENGRWIFDAGVVVIDRNGHLRQAVVPKRDPQTQRVVTSATVAFDFDQAADWDRQGLRSGTDLTNEQQLERLLQETIAGLLTESFQES